MADRSTIYHRRQFWLGVAELALSIGCLLVFLGAGIGAGLSRAAGERGFAPWLEVALILIALGFTLKIATAPLDWIRGFWLPRRFGILHQTFAHWCWDRTKGALIGGALALAATEIVYALLRTTPLWWLWAAGIFFVGYVLLAMAVPIWIVPLFYTMVPLEDAGLRERLLDLARRAGVRVIGVWVADQSKKSKTANAALTGLGRTRRILLFDTLVQQFTVDEVESVLAHEMSHHVHGDIWRGLAVQGALTLATFWIADGLLRMGSARLGFDGPADPAGLPLFGLIVTGLGLLAAPLGNSFSRWMERRADDFALATTGNPGAFISAMDRLADLNLAERRPNRIKEFLLYSHPSIERRIERARARPVIATVAALLVIALAAPAQGQARVEVVATGLEVPWALAFAPDGRLFVTERPGRIRVVKDGRLDPEPAATLGVAAVGEGGLMGLALDPAFSANGHLYACYTAEHRGGLVNRVVRLTLSEGRARSERVLLDDIPGAQIHDGCRVKFGPDGKLYVTTGDAAEPGLAQRRDSPAGKILRLNADGSVPKDNPLPGSPIYSLGHRNPQGLAWHRSGQLFASEHGPTGHDEVNRILPGRNYGWPEVRGRGGDARYQDPAIESGSDTWAPSGIAFLGDDLFVAALRGRRLLRMTFAPDLSRAVRMTALLEGTHGRLRDVVVGPDGALYITTSNRDGRWLPGLADDRILRVTP
jgi:glucose/arabinose dehydrogenase/Zn-dependent protease with chaperone function